MVKGGKGFIRGRVKYEYELMRYLEEKGYFVIRLPASGKKRHFDLLAYKDGKLYAIEVKSTKNEVKEVLRMLSKEQLEALRRYEELYGIVGLIAVRKVGLGKGAWWFYDVKGNEVRQFP